MQAKFAIARGRNSSRAKESLCCDSGIIRFAENSIASCEQFGLHSESDSKTIPHLYPLPLGKGEARSKRRSNLCELPMCSSGLAGTKQHEFFDGMYAIRSTIPPRPACGERIEVRGVLNPRREV